MKKYVSAFLALLCIFSLSAIAYAAPGETTAPDEIVLDRNFLSSSDMTEVDGNVVLTREIAAAPRTRSAAAECARESQRNLLCGRDHGKYRYLPHLPCSRK